MKTINELRTELRHAHNDYVYALIYGRPTDKLRENLNRLHKEVERVGIRTAEKS